MTEQTDMTQAKPDQKDTQATQDAAAPTVLTPADPVKSKWPDSWRMDLANGDEKAAKTFERFQNPSDAGKAYLEAVNRIRSGELAKPLPKDATPEQVTEWRKGNGIPEKPEDYFAKLPDGLVIGEEDKELWNEAAKILHEKNARPEIVHGLIGWYAKMQENAVAQQKQLDMADAQKATDTLRSEWGNDYRANVNLAMSYLEPLGDLKEQVMDAQLPDGTRLFNNPDFMKFIVGQAREINPAGIIAPAGGADQVQSIQAEIDKIEGMMRTNRTAYNKDEKVQARYRQLIEARQKLQERGRAA